MIKQISVFESSCLDPYTNLAMEKCLLDTVRPEECMLYLWQNRNTVVLGRNQNAWAECRTSLLEAEGGTLARRPSGGGAVFHDLGNLNFSFLMRKEDYDLERQFLVIQKACAIAGIHAERSGRNDLFAEGKKFSGSAFYQERTHACHHGTLMVDVDKAKAERYLSPSKARLDTRAVPSVRSRLVNLREFSPQLDTDAMKRHMITAFCQIYRLPPHQAALVEGSLKQLEALRRKYAAWEYLFGNPQPFHFQCEARFSWGYIQIQLEAKKGMVTAAKVYTDAMDWQFPKLAEHALTGCRFHAADMCRSIDQISICRHIRADLCALLSKQGL